MPEQEEAGLGEVVDVEKFPAGGACPPDGHRGGTGFPRLVKAPDEARDDV